MRQDRQQTRGGANPGRVGPARVRRQGFTLIEVAVATVIVGLGVVAVLMTSGSTSRVNASGRDLMRGLVLVQEMREWTMSLPFSDPDPGDIGNPPGHDGSDPQVFVDDLDDLMNVTYSPPRDAMGTTIYDMEDWSQTITLTWLNPADLSQTVSDGASDVINVKVDIRYNGQPVVESNWLATRRSSP